MSDLYPGSQQVEPMKYGNKPSESIIESTWASGNWIAQAKVDGAWYQLEKTDAGDVYLFGRTVSKKTGEYTEKIANVPHIKQWAETYLPNGTTLIGEIYVPGGKSNTVTQIMGCLPEKAYRRQFDQTTADVYLGPAHYYIFDIIRFKGKDLCDVPCIERIEHYLEYQILDLFQSEEYVELADTYYNDFAVHLQDIFAAGGEGMVFKEKNCPYRPGKRTTVSQMYKYKEHMDSVDLVCIGLEDPVKEYTGKEIDTWPYWIDDEPVTKPYYHGWKNAIRLGAYEKGQLVEVGRVASGLTDELRADMAKHPENYLNKIIEIECMSVNVKDKTIRHPVFKKVRDDKSPQDCLIEEIFS